MQVPASEARYWFRRVPISSQLGVLGFELSEELPELNKLPAEVLRRCL